MSWYLVKSLLTCNHTRQTHLITSLSSPTTSYIQIIFQSTTTKASKTVWSGLGNKPGGEMSEMLSSVSSHPPHNGIIRTNLNHWVTVSAHLTKHGLRGAIHWHSLQLYLPFKWVYWCLESVTMQPRPLEVTMASQRKERQTGTALLFYLFHFYRSSFSFSRCDFIMWAMENKCPSSPSSHHLLAIFSPCPHHLLTVSSPFSHQLQTSLLSSLCWPFRKESAAHVGWP